MTGEELTQQKKYGEKEKNVKFIALIKESCLCLNALGTARHGAQVGHERKRRHHGRTEGSKREREREQNDGHREGFAVRRAFRECFGECVLVREFLVVAL